MNKFGLEGKSILQCSMKLHAARELTKRRPAVFPAAAAGQPWPLQEPQT
jgi:hypothetical protein